MPRRTERAHLVDVAYATDAGLSARSSLYVHQSPRWDLPAEALDLLGDVDGCTVLDVGCGNGRYLAPLAAAGAHVIGIDLSAGMLAAVPAPRPPLLQADVTALPVPDAVADAVLLPHMLYHVPQPARGLREARRALRPGGRVLVVVNGPAHLRQMSDLWAALVADAGVPDEPVDSDLLNPLLLAPEALALVEDHFAGTMLRSLVAEVTLTDPAPAAHYVASTTAAHVVGPELVERFRRAVADRIERDGAFRITTDVVMILAHRPA